MSEASKYVPKVGDEVEVVRTHRGVVTKVVRDWIWVNNGHAYELTHPATTSVTRVRRPLPTEPGYAVEFRLHDAPYVEPLWVHLYPDGWRSIGGDYIDPDDLAAHDWRIVSVPVQEGHKVLDRDYDAVQDGEAK